MSSELVKLLSPRHIQETGRELWQQYHDADKLHVLPTAVANDIASEVWMILFPDDEIVETLSDIKYPGIPELIEELVLECLDMDELEREAQENTDDYLYREECKKGQY